MTPKLIALMAAGLAALFLANNAAAISDYIIKDPTKLEGIVYATKWACPKADKPCTAYFELHGQSARRLYDNMRASMVEDICTRGKMKTDRSGLHCFHSAEDGYGCFFGYDFVKRQIVEGHFSC